METTNIGEPSSQPTAVKPLWEVMTSNTDTIAAPAPEAKTIDPQTKDTVTETVIEPEVKSPAAEPAKAPEVIETPAAEPAKTDEVLELGAADIKDVPKLFEPNSLQAIAQDLGFQVEKPEDFKKTFQDNFVAKSELEKVRAQTKESLFKELNPQIATAFEMIELGVPQELALNPTAIQDQYLAMESAELVREGIIANNPGYDEEMVDSEMEKLSADPNRLEIEARKIRANLTHAKQNILNEQSQLVKKYTEQKQQIEIEKKAQADTQFKEVLNKELTFLGLKLSSEAKSLIEKKYDSGAYDNLFSVADSKLKAILQHEFGDKFSKAAVSKAKEEGKAEIVKKLADVPDTKKQGGGRSIDNTPVATNQNEPLSTFPTNF